MATLAQVRDGIQSILQAEIPTLQVHARFDSLGSLPAAILVPAEVDYRQVMGRAHMEWQLDLHVLASAAVSSLGQYGLDELIDIDGDGSIVKALFSDDLNLPGTQAHVASMTGYGGQFEAVGIPHIGATLRVVVQTKGASA